MSYPQVERALVPLRLWQDIVNKDEPAVTIEYFPTLFRKSLLVTAVVRFISISFLDNLDNFIIVIPRTKCITCAGNHQRPKPDAAIPRQVDAVVRQGS